MIISTLLYLIRNGVVVEEDSRYSSPVQSLMDPEAHSKQFLAGDYRIVLNLLGILDHGRTSKHFADFAIDMCAQVQNLREAIFNFKMRVEGTSLATAGSIPSAEDVRKLEATRVCGLNYLARYFYLIVFAEFMLDRIKTKGTGPGATDTEFSSWLADHREISNLITNPKALDFS